MAEECIDKVISHASDGRCLGAFLASSSHKLPTVRAKAAAVVLRCVQKFNPSEAVAAKAQQGRLDQTKSPRPPRRG